LVQIDLISLVAALLVDPLIFRDMAFDEDSNRTRQGYSASNLAVIRHIALNLIKNEKSSKVGVKTKRLKAGWSDDYLLKIIGRI